MIELSFAGYIARIEPSRGGNCVGLSRFGAEILRTPKTAEDFEKEPFFFGTPLLFFPNRISEGSFEFEGRTYRFPVNEPSTGCFIHGTLHETPFEVLFQSDTEALLEYRATAREPYLSFPHPFTLRIAYTLDGAGLSQTVTVRNDSPSDMPTALGFHTAFRLPFSDSSPAENITMRMEPCLEYTRDPVSYLPDGSTSLAYSEKDELDKGIFRPALHPVSRLLQMGSEQQIVLTDAITGIRARYRALRGYRFWMVYKPGNSGFLCVEPQSCLSNCPNAPFDRNSTGFDYLRPGEERQYRTLLSIDRCSGD